MKAFDDLLVTTKNDGLVSPKQEVSRKPAPQPLYFATPREALEFCERYQSQPCGLVVDPTNGKWVILVDLRPLSAKPVVWCTDGSLQPLDGVPIVFVVG